MMRAIATCGLALVTLCGGFAGQLRAADLSPAYPAPPLYSEPDPQFEFGTGWYLRGDVGYSDSSTVQPFGDLPKLTSSTDWTGDIGAGYRWNNWFRTDLSVNFDGYQHLSSNTDNVTCAYTLTPQVTSAGAPNGYFWTPGQGTCEGRNQASLLKTDVMVGGYVDLGTWYGLTPYVGAGVGFARLDTWSSTNYYKSSDGTPYKADLSPLGGFPLIWRDVNGNALNPTVPTTGYPVAFSQQNWSASAHRTQYNFAWSLMAGVAYAVDDHMTIDLGYRYLNLGDYRDGNGRDKTLDAQQVRLGVRYAID